MDWEFLKGCSFYDIQRMDRQELAEILFLIIQAIARLEEKEEQR